MKVWWVVKVKTIHRFYLFNLRSSWNIIYTSYFTKQKKHHINFKFLLCLAGWRCGFHPADADTTLPTFQAKCNSHPQRSTVLFVLKCRVNEENTIAVSPLFGKKANNWIMSKWIQVVAYKPPRCCSVWIWESSEIWQCKQSSSFSRILFLDFLSVTLRFCWFSSACHAKPQLAKPVYLPFFRKSTKKCFTTWAALEGTFPENSPKRRYAFQAHTKYIEIQIFNTQHYTSKSQAISTKEPWKILNMEEITFSKTSLKPTMTTFINIHQALPQKGWCNRCSPHLLGLALEMPRPCTTRLPPETRSRGHRSCRDWWLHRFEWPTNFCSNTPFARQTLANF